MPTTDIVNRLGVSYQSLPAVYALNGSLNAESQLKSFSTVWCHMVNLFSAFNVNT